MELIKYIKLNKICTIRKIALHFIEYKKMKYADIILFSCKVLKIFAVFKNSVYFFNFCKSYNCCEFFWKSRKKFNFPYYSYFLHYSFFFFMKHENFFPVRDYLEIKCMVNNFIEISDDKGIFGASHILENKVTENWF